MAEDADLPKALVKRIVKAKLTTLQPQVDADDQKREVQLNKDALLAFAESSKIFIAYVTATANDICKQAKRQIISGEDVATALEELEFDSFVGPIRQSLESEDPFVMPYVACPRQLCLAIMIALIASMAIRKHMHLHQYPDCLA